VIDPEQDYEREEGVPEPRRWHYSDRDDNPCAPPAEVLTKLFTADDPRPEHREPGGEWTRLPDEDE